MPPTAANKWAVLRHVEHEGIGTLSKALESADIRHTYIDLFRGAAVPDDPARFAGLVVMGGPMGVYEADRYSFLKPELALIRRAADAGLPVLGICLGAQLIAASLGARVYRGPRKEIGWYPVEVKANDPFTAGLPARFMGFHWHGDTFALPEGGIRLFRSSLYQNQGFRWRKNVLALQFHFEITAEMVGEWLEDPGCRAELAALPDVDPEIIQQQTARWAGQLEKLSSHVFGRFLEVTAGSRHS